MKPAPVGQEFVQAVNQKFGMVDELLLRTRQRLYALEVREQLAEEGRTPRGRVEFRSQFGEDLWIWDVLGGQAEGFFIEAGAFDGYHLSVTYALEMVGWKGLLVEPLPKAFEACRVRRPHSRVVNTAISKRGSAGTVKFSAVADHYGGMLSFIKAPTEHAREI